jgi:septal ring factor EnvC (AmiA/AmiB activator)
VPRNFGNEPDHFNFIKPNKEQNGEFLDPMTIEDNTKILSGRNLKPASGFQNYNPEGDFEGRKVETKELSQHTTKLSSEEVQKLKKKNGKLMKENSLFREEYRVLMSTIKNLQSEVSKSKNNNKNENKSQNKMGLKAIESQKMKRQYEFLMKENQRLKNMNETMKNFSREDFSKILEMNTYYKMLNEELNGYIDELKTELSKISRLAND